MPVYLGSTTVALKLGTQSVAGYAGGTLVTATVPGAPTITNTGQELIPQGGTIQLAWTAPSSDGGSPITAYRVYADGQLLPNADFTLGAFVGLTVTVNEADAQWGGEDLQVSAVNAIGEGPKSNGVIIV